MVHIDIINKDFIYIYLFCLKESEKVTSYEQMWTKIKEKRKKE